MYKLQSMSDKEILRIVVKETRPSALDILLEEKSVAELIYNMTYEEIIAIEGIGIKSAEKIMAVQELLKRIAKQQHTAKVIKITRPEKVYDLMKPIIGHLKHEEFHAVFLNTKNVVVRHKMISVGSLNASIVHPREVFSKAIKYNSCSLIVVHNHPSKDVNPSNEDISITKRLQEAGVLLGIPLLDHVIIGDSYYSFKEAGEL